MLNGSDPAQSLIDALAAAVSVWATRLGRELDPFACGGLQWWANDVPHDITIAQLMDSMFAAIETGEGNDGWAFALLRWIPDELPTDVRMRAIETINPDQALSIAAQATEFSDDELLALKTKCSDRLQDFPHLAAKVTEKFARV